LDSHPELLKLTDSLWVVVQEVPHVLTQSIDFGRIRAVRRSWVDRQVVPENSPGTILVDRDAAGVGRHHVVVVVSPSHRVDDLGPHSGGLNTHAIPSFSPS